MSLLVAALGSLLLLYSPAAVQAQTTQQLLQSRLDEFLVAAGRHDVAVFERFFADDLVYTRATGETTSKAEILANVRAARAKGPDGQRVTYGAEEVRVEVFRDDLAAINFRLVQHTEGRPTAEFRNTGTFLRRDGRWQVIVWQATRIAAGGG